MYSCDNCEETGYDIGELYPVEGSFENGMLCKTCNEEFKEHKAESDFIKIRFTELEKWIEDQGNISLDQLMTKAYMEFIDFTDYGMILHLYMKAKNKNK